MAQNNFFYFPAETKAIRTDTAQLALSKLKEGGFIWLSFNQPTYNELMEISKPLGLHELSIEDCLDDNQIPKIENYETNTFILFNSIKFEHQHLKIEEINLFIGKNFIITVNRRNSDEKNLLENLENSLLNEKNSAFQNSVYLLHHILDQIVDKKFHALEVIEDELDKVEEQIIDESSDYNPSYLQRLRRELQALRKSLFHEREILVRICRQDSPFIPESSLFHFRDIYDHLAKFYEQTETFRDTITSLMELHLSLMNNQMAITAQKTNVTMRRLTFITTIFMPLTLLSGIGGMSEWSMMTGPDNWKVSYPLFLLLMLVIAIANYFFLKWIDKRS